MKPEEVRKLREELKLTQEQLAEQLGVGAAAIANWERGRRSPRGPALKMLEWLSKHGRSERAPSADDAAE